MSKPKTVALTCTGGRPDAFALCERWVASQTVAPDAWVVIDDYCDPTICTMGQTVVRPRPYWKPGDSTIARNMIVGLEVCVGLGADVVVVVEDDDHYSPEWTATALEHLGKTCDLVGEGWTHYYNINSRRWARCSNSAHASLCATAFSTDLAPGLIDLFAKNETAIYLDILLWREHEKSGTLLESANVIGIKGMPGRAGLGAGHTGDRRFPNFDCDGSALRRLIGDDADFYKRFSSVNYTDEDEKLARKLLSPISAPCCGSPPNELLARIGFVQRLIADRVAARQRNEQ